VLVTLAKERKISSEFELRTAGTRWIDRS
jgi:hypothetical protein